MPTAISFKKLAGVLAIAAFVTACKNSGEKTVENDTTKAKVIHEEGWPDEQTLPFVFTSGDTLINVDFSHAEKDVIAAANGIVNDKNTVVCEVNIQHADSLFAELKHENGGSDIYFNRIVSKGTDTFGNFGNITQVKTANAGIYRLFITKEKETKSSQKFRIRLWLK